MQNTLKKTIISAMALTMLAGCASGAGKKEAEPEMPAEQPAETATTAPEVQHDIVNIAVFGIDDESDGIKAPRADAIKVVSFDYDENTIDVISVPRDLEVMIGGSHNAVGPINEAVEYGGSELQLQTLNDALGLEIEKYVQFDYEALGAVVDAIGGVDIELTQEEIDQTNKPLDIKGEAGVYTLNGKQAMMYSRIYKIDGEEARMDRSVKLMKAVFAQAKELSAVQLAGVVARAFPHVHTNMSMDEIIQYANDVMGFDLGNIKTHTLASSADDIKAEVSEILQG